MSLPTLPVELHREGSPDRTASTPAEYWDLVYRGFKPSGEAELSPQQKAARTRAANREQEEQKTSTEGSTDTAGTAAGDES